VALDAAKNFAKVGVSTGYDASATSIVLTAGHGAKLPAAPYNLVWWDATNYPDPSDDPNVEIVSCTSRTTDTLTVTRAQESTSATTKNTGGATYKMIAGFTEKTYSEIAAVVYAFHIPRVAKLSSTGFNGSTKTFTNWLPTAPDIATSECVLLQTGVGVLVRVASGEANGEFSLSGGTNRTINFGFAPRSGDVVYAIYVDA